MTHDPAAAAHLFAENANKSTEQFGWIEIEIQCIELMEPMVNLVVLSGVG